MINFDEIIYNIVRKKIKKTENIESLNKIVNILLDDPNGDTSISRYQATELYKYFRRMGIATNNIELQTNDALHTAVALTLNSSLFTAQTPDASTDNIKKYIIGYVSANNSTDIDVDKLYSAEPISDDAYNKFKTSVTNCKSLTGLLSLMLNNGFANSFTTAVNDSNNTTFDEFLLPNKLYEAFNNPSIIKIFETEGSFDIYKNIFGSRDDKELATSMKVIDSQIDDSNISNDSSILLDTFLNTKLNIKKNDLNPLPQDVTNVQEFLSSISSDAMNKVRSQVTSEVITRWNTQLDNAYKSATGTALYKQFFIDFSKLQTDEDLVDFYKAKWPNETNELKLNPDSEEPALLLTKVKDAKLSNGTVSEVVTKLMDESTLSSEKDFTDTMTSIKQVIDTLNRFNQPQLFYEDFLNLQNDNDLLTFCKTNWPDDDFNIILDDLTPDLILNKVKQLKITGGTVESVYLQYHDNNKQVTDRITEFLKKCINTVIEQTAKNNANDKKNQKSKEFYEDFLNLQSDDDLLEFCNTYYKKANIDIEEDDNDPSAILTKVRETKLVKGTVAETFKMLYDNNKPVTNKVKSYLLKYITRAVTEVTNARSNNEANSDKKQIFINFQKLLTDEDLQTFCQENWPNDNITLNIDDKSEDPSEILTKAKNIKFPSGTVDEFVKKIVDSEELLSDRDFNQYKANLKKAITTAATLKSNENDVNTKYKDLLVKEILINPDENETIDFASLLASLCKKENNALFSKKVINIDGSETNLTYGDNILEKLKLTTPTIDNTLEFNKQCTFDKFQLALTVIVNDQFNNIKLINEFGNNTDIWSENKGNKNISGYMAINTLYNIFSNSNILGNHAIRLFYLTLRKKIEL